MCGIIALLSLDPSASPDPQILEAMRDSLRHRGPDDAGLWISGPVGLGHRRLSIIDLESGRQPLFNEEGSVGIVLNGEIYNFAELRYGLQHQGHRFSTASDTESIVHAYEEHGLSCLTHLNGMFAFALWDGRERRLFCARDRMGKKPLYYTMVDRTVMIASELKAFYRHPRFRPEIDPAALSAYLAFEYVPAPMTILRGVKKLQAGHYFRIDANDPPHDIEAIEQVAYWDLAFDPQPRPDDVLARELIDQLRRAVERRLVSDVPLGVFLSGGIDSSAIVAMMAQLREPSEIKTFTIAFDEPSFDESQHARTVARHFGTDHHEESMPAERALEILPQVIELLDEPFADPSILPTFLLSEFTRRHVTVALGGDGGDELFAGYDPFKAHHAGKLAARLPQNALAALKTAASFLPTSHRNISFDFKVKRFLGGVEYPLPQRHWAWLGSFPPGMQKELLSAEVLGQVLVEDVYAPAERYWNACGSTAAQAGKPVDDVHRAIYQYCKLYLQDGILTKLDRASMAHALEARSPMLDHEFVEWSATVPSDRKLRGMERKFILKHALRGLLPDAIIDRSKKGFGMPIGQWFRGPLRAHLQDRLGRDSLEQIGLFNCRFVDGLVEEHLAGRRDHRKELWTLLMFVEWWRKYM